MLISTTSNLAGKEIKEYRGVVFGEVVNGVNYFKDFSLSITNVIGGRATEMENELVKSRADALTEMMNRAERIGANAIIGVKVDYETIGDQAGMLMVVVSGTAVLI